MGKNRETDKQDNSMSNRHKKRHPSKNELDLENRDNNNKKGNRIQRTGKRNI